MGLKLPRMSGPNLFRVQPCLHLLPRKDVEGDDVRLGVAVLPRLRRRNLHALARVALARQGHRSELKRR